MGCRGVGPDLPYCDMPRCGRRANVETEEGLFCFVCDVSISNERLSESAQRLACCSPARQSSAPLQAFLQNPILSKTCMEFLHGDGWERQCECTRCNHSWLNEGWVCPVEYRRREYLQMLDSLFINNGYGTWRGTTSELRYVDWQVAVRRIHDMYTDEIPWDIRALVEFARLSAGQVHDELRRTYPDEEFPGAPHSPYP